MGKIKFKDTFRTKQGKISLFLILSLIFVCFAGTLVVTLFDREISAYFVNLGETNTFALSISKFFERSLFDGDSFGGQDLSFLLTLLALLLYFLAYIPIVGEKLKLKSSRKYLGFFISSALILTIINRGLKALVGRVRPYDVATDSSLYSPIWEMGSYNFSDALSEGSFTSGHTNAAVLLVVLAFILIKTHKTWAISTSFVVTIGYSILMAISRVILKKHYLTDGLYAIIIGIVVMGTIYFFIFKIPKQESGEKEEYSKMEDIRVGVLSSLFTVIVFAILICLKLAVSNFVWWYLTIMLIGPIFAYISYRRVKYILK